MDISNEMLRQLFSDWFYSSTPDSREFKKVLLQLSRNMSVKSKGFITIRFDSYDDFYVFIGDRSKAKIDYRTTKDSNIPIQYREKYRNLDTSRQFLLYSIFGKGDKEATLMDIITV